MRRTAAAVMTAVSIAAAALFIAASPGSAVTVTKVEGTVTPDEFLALPGTVAWAARVYGYLDSEKYRMVTENHESITSVIRNGKTIRMVKTLFEPKDGKKGYIIVMDTAGKDACSRWFTTKGETNVKADRYASWACEKGTAEKYRAEEIANWRVASVVGAFKDGNVTQVLPLAVDDSKLLFTVFDPGTDTPSTDISYVADGPKLTINGWYSNDPSAVWTTTRYTRDGVPNLLPFGKLVNKKWR